MLHLLTLFTGFSLVFAVATQAGASPQRWLLVLVAAAVSAGFAARAGGASGAFTRAPQAMAMWVMRTPAMMAEALATVRAAVAADVSLKPALVRVRGSGAIGASPGPVVINTDGESTLLHVLDEDRMDASARSASQARVSRDEGGA